MRQPADLQQLRKRSFMVVGEKADARHTRVQLQMHVQDVICPGKRRIQLLRVFERMHLLRDVHEHHRVRKACRSVAENEHRRADAAAPELNGLLEVGNRQILRAQLAQRVAQRHRAVAVGVGLHDAKKPAPLGNVIFDRAVIVLQIIQRHLRPGSFQCFHCCLDSWQTR